MVHAGLVHTSCSNTQLCLPSSLRSCGQGVGVPLRRLVARGSPGSGRASQTKARHRQRTREVTAKCDLPRMYDLSEDERWTMSCLVPRDTGLKMAVFIPTGVVYKYYKKQPVMLVKADYGLENPYDGCFFQLSLKAQPELIDGPGNILAEDIEQAKIFVQENLDFLLKIWDHELGCGAQPFNKA